MAWGEGDYRQAKAAMREVNRQRNGVPSLPVVRLAPMCAAGPSGERQEHDIVKFASASSRRRLFKAIDDLTVRWAIGGLPAECRWRLNTQVMFLQKAKEPLSKLSDDEEWLAALSQSDSSVGAPDRVFADILESAVVGGLPRRLQVRAVAVVVP